MNGSIIFVGAAPGRRGPDRNGPLGGGRCARVMEDLLGMSNDEWLACRRTNLNKHWPGKKGKGDDFDMIEAKGTALLLVRRPANKRFVLLGRNAAAAFLLKFRSLRVTAAYDGKRFFFRMNKTGKNGEQNRPPVVKKTTKLADGSIIRKGQRKPVNKPSANEREDRIQELAEFIMKHPFASRKAMSDRFCKRWNASWNTIEWSYVSPARRRVTILSRMTEREAREKALGVVMSMMDHPRAEIRLKAVTAFSRITGIETRKMELFGPGGGPIQLQAARPLADLSPGDLRKLADAALQRHEIEDEE